LIGVYRRPNDFSAERPLQSRRYGGRLLAADERR
jgi:hypothetical protein